MKAVGWGLAVALLALTPAPAAASFTQTANGGFIISQTGQVRASPDIVWEELTHPERWWNKAHSWSHDSANFTMTLVPGGCFCEKLPNGGFAEHARIIFADPPRLLRLSGALGPLQGESLVGTLTVRITKDEMGSTSVSFEYAVGGNSRLVAADLAPLVDAVIGDQHGRLLKRVSQRAPD